MKDIMSIKKRLEQKSAINGKAGVAIMSGMLNEEKIRNLVIKHYNSITCENEMKPEIILGDVPVFRVDTEGNICLDENGDPVLTLDFSKADKIMYFIKKHNEKNPDDTIRVRGHVLVWHSQTPEWIFHENYDISKPYVDKATMNRRLEWYISSVLDHYFGEAANKKYDGLFYGWDVVNEAVIGNTYRTDKVNPAESLDEIRHGNNSSWWHVYQSNEFIINAFKYANKYAPSDVELYYNDFGETDNIKSEGIIKLISDVKSAQGTRLDAFGMQAHYSVDSFSAAQFKRGAGGEAGGGGSKKRQDSRQHSACTEK